MYMLRHRQRDVRRHPVVPVAAWQRFKDWMNHRERNDSLVDVWSFIHLVTGALMAWVMDPFFALLIMVLWEPLEILVLSPFAEKVLGFRFGFETLRNSMSDIVFDAAGVAVGFWILRRAFDPPFML